MRVTSYVGLALALLWVAGKDYCLLVGLPSAATPDLGMAIFGFATQVLGSVGVYSMLTRGRYVRGVIDYVSRRSLKATLFVLPFIFLFLSHHVIATGLYGAGPMEKLATSQNADLALRRCSTMSILKGRRGTESPRTQFPS